MGRALRGTNRWMSDPSKGLPAWIELQWPQTIDVGEVQITFDTGMHRLLTLSHSDVYTAKMDWGRPQPETVRDYTVDGFLGGQSIRLIEASGNYQRMNRHTLPQAQRVDTIRITVEATNGIDHSRINGIRIYE